MSQCQHIFGKKAANLRQDKFTYIRLTTFRNHPTFGYMPNIKFNYLYRDGGNYKKFNSIIFENEESSSLEELELLIKSKLIDGEWFYADQWKIPEIFLSTFDFKIDPTWHEFESVEYTDEPSNSTFSLADFIETLKGL